VVVAEATDMAQREIEKLRRELDGIVGRQGRCFPRDFKERVARWILARRLTEHKSELAAELGLVEGTVLRWSKGSARSQTPAHVPVTVADRRLSVVSPSGFRVDELTFAEEQRCCERSDDLGTSRAVRVFAYREAVDLRKATTGSSGS
jgi:hypothetical protein